MTPVDARLVPAALLAWGAAFVALTVPTAVTVTMGGALLLVGVVAATRLRRAPTAVRGRHRADAPTQVAAAVLLAAAVGAAVLLVTCAQVHVRATAPLTALAEARASATVVGEVRTEPRPVRSAHPGHRYRLELAVSTVHGRGHQVQGPARVVLVGPESWTAAALGERVRVRVRLAPTDRTDPAAALALTQDAPERLRGPAGHLAVVSLLRGHLRDVTAQLSPQAQGLVPGIAVGDDRALPADLAEAMRATSLTHLTAVSGAHVAILLGCVLLVVAALPRGAKVSVAGLSLLAFVALVRPEPSVLRSATMGAVVLGGLALGRPSRALPALCAAVVALVLADPWLARSYGFVLSVLATAGLVLLARPWSRALSRYVPRWAATLVAVPAAAQAVCGPVVLLLAPAVSLYAVPANVLAAPAVPPATVLGVLATLVAPWWPGAATVLVHGAAACTWWIAAVARFFADLPAAQLPWPSGPVGAAVLAVATVLLLLAVRSSMRGSTAGLRVVIAAAATVMIALSPPARSWLVGWPPPRWEAVQCDVGQGAAFVQRSGTSSAVMVDVGPVGGGAARCLATLGVRHLDLLVLTHAHADHVGDLPAVLDAVSVTQVLLTPAVEPPATTAAVLELLAVRQVPVSRPTAGAAGTAGQVRWEVLWPTRRAVSLLAGPDGVNDLSLVLSITGPHLRVLAPGDVELAGQAGLHRLLRTGRVPQHDVVLMPHHGSARQDAGLAREVGGRLVLVSVGAGNDYGHPASSALSLYRQGGALVRRTDTCGAVAVVVGAEGPQVVGERACPDT